MDPSPNAPGGLDMEEEQRCQRRLQNDADLNALLARLVLTTARADAFGGIGSRLFRKDIGLGSKEASIQGIAQ